MFLANLAYVLNLYTRFIDGVCRGYSAAAAAAVDVNVTLLQKGNTGKHLTIGSVTRRWNKK